MRQLAIEEAFTKAKTPIAYIRLRGNWLVKAGFNPRSRARVVIVSPGMIALKAIDSSVSKETSAQNAMPAAKKLPV
jgi:hypothetical protein